MDNTAPRLHLLACLGRDGAGELFRATMTIPGRVHSEVAVRLLRADLSPTSADVRRLRTEARLLNRIAHPTLQRVHDVVRVDQRAALIRELLDGETLDRCLTGPDRIGLRAVLAVLAEVAAALDVVWSSPGSSGDPLRLVQRNLSPATILIGRHGNVKLIDFGVPFPPDGGHGYLAPERFHDETVTPASEVYALGCILYEALAGQGLFEGLTVAQIYGTMLLSSQLQAHLAARAARIPSDTPKPVRELVFALLEPNPAARPTAREAAGRSEDLAEAVGGPSLKRWAQDRAWSASSEIPDGRTLTIEALDAPRREPPATPPAPPLVPAMSAPSEPPRPVPAAPTPFSIDAPPPPSVSRSLAAPPAVPTEPLAVRPLAPGLEPPVRAVAPASLEPPPAAPRAPAPLPEPHNGGSAGTPSAFGGFPASDTRLAGPTDRRIADFGVGEPPPPPEPVTDPLPGRSVAPPVGVSGPTLAPVPLVELSAPVNGGAQRPPTAPRAPPPPDANDPDADTVPVFAVPPTMLPPRGPAPPAPLPPPVPRLAQPRPSVPPPGAADPHPASRSASVEAVPPPPIEAPVAPEILGDPSARPAPAPPKPPPAPPRPPPAPAAPVPVHAPPPVPGVFDGSVEPSFEGAHVHAVRRRLDLQQLARAERIRRAVAIGLLSFAGLSALAAWVGRGWLSEEEVPAGLEPGYDRGRVPSPGEVPPGSLEGMLGSPAGARGTAPVPATTDAGAARTTAAELTLERGLRMDRPPGRGLPADGPPDVVVVQRGWDRVEGDAAGALALFEEALRLGPGDAEALYGKGYALLRLGRPGEATESLCRAISAGDMELDREVRSVMARNHLSCL